MPIYDGDGFDKELARAIINRMLRVNKSCEHSDECMHYCPCGEDERLPTLFIDIVQKALSAPDLDVLAQKLSDASKKKGY